MAITQHDFTLSSEPFADGLKPDARPRLADQFRGMLLTLSGMVADFAFDIQHTLARLEAEIDLFLDHWQRD